MERARKREGDRWEGVRERKSERARKNERARERERETEQGAREEGGGGRGRFLLRPASKMALAAAPLVIKINN